MHPKHYYYTTLTFFSKFTVPAVYHLIVILPHVPFEWYYKMARLRDGLDAISRKEEMD